MPRINGINFYQNRSKIKLFLPKKSFFSSAGGSDPHTLCLRWLGVLPPESRPQLPPVVGGSAPRVRNTSPHCRFLAARLHEEKFTAGLHLYWLLVLNIPGTFGEENVCIHKRCIIRSKVFHPVILIQKNYLKKSCHLHQSHFGFGRDEVFSF